MERQSRNKSVLFWIGLASAVYEAVMGSLMSAGVPIQNKHLPLPPLI